MTHPTRYDSPVTTKLARRVRRTSVLLVGVPLLLFLVITALVVIPGVIKGERFTPGGQATQDQWFGGPSKGTAELPAPDNDESKAGGASGRW